MRRWPDRSIACEVFHALRAGLTRPDGAWQTRGTSWGATPWWIPSAGDRRHGDSEAPPVAGVLMTIVASSVYAFLATGLGAISLLLVLLILRELLRAHGGPRARAWMRPIGIAIGPLLIGCVVIVGLRLARLMRVG
jgi:hypothetical protein